jgi:hypothetical protein
MGDVPGKSVHDFKGIKFEVARSGEKSFEPGIDNVLETKDRAAIDKDS